MSQRTSRGHIYTIWVDPVTNPANRIFAKLDAAFENGTIKAYTGQEEIAPSTERRHIQLYVEWPKPQRGSRIERLVGIRHEQYHGEQRRGSAAQADDYCSKEDTRAPGAEVHRRGAVSKGQGTRSDLRRVADRVIEGDDLRQIAIAHGSEYIKYHKGIRALRETVHKSTHEYRRKEVIILHGATGTGKTRFVTETFGDSLWFAPITEKGEWADGYEGEATAFFDEYRGQHRYETVLRLTDGYDVSHAYKGGFLNFKPRRIIFASNTPYQQWWPTINDLSALERRITHVFDFGNIPYVMHAPNYVPLEDPNEVPVNVTSHEVGGNTIPPLRSSPSDPMEEDILENNLQPFDLVAEADYERMLADL